MKTVLFIVLLILTVIAGIITLWMVLLYRAFSYNGKRQMSKQIIEGVASYVSVPDGGKILDVGCGSGALAIACAKRNPKAEVIGIDRWGKEYASFSRQLCERNARAEKVNNTKFQHGDAVKLDFADETFDAVTSNYVYHNIPGDRQTYLPARYLFKIKVRRYASLCQKAERVGLRKGRADRHDRTIYEKMGTGVDGAVRLRTVGRQEVIGEKRVNVSVTIGVLIPFIGTSLGAAFVFFMKRQLGRNVQRALTGFAAGVMTAASV